MANKFTFDTSGFDEMIRKYERAGGDLKEIVEKSLKLASEKITKDTEEGMQKANLPAHGKYSTGKTADTIVRNPEVNWTGTTASIGVGFDFNKPSAAGYLITGTPRMKRDKKLFEIYRSKKYRERLKEEINAFVGEELKKLGE